MERPSRLPMFLGVVLLASGWAVIMLGWYQAGRQELETGQLPYVISGGFGGFGLLLMGVILVMIDVVRQSEWKLRRSAEDLHARLEELAESFVLQSNGEPERREEVREARPRPRRRRRRRPQQRTPGASP